MSKNTNLSFLTDYITADITNGRIGINNASPTVAFDVTGATKITGVLTLTSTISNGTYAYTLPSATGTLALTSALSGTTNYIPKFTSSSTIGNSTLFDDGNALITSTSSIYVNKANPFVRFKGTTLDAYIINSNDKLYIADFNTATKNIVLDLSTGAATFSSSVMVNGSTVSTEGLSVQYNQAKTYTTQTAVSRWHSNESTGSQFKLNLFAIGNATGSSRVFSFQTSNEGVANDGIISFQAGGGNVGIGTTSPSDQLHITTTSGNGIKISTNDITTLKMTITSGALKNWGFATNNTAASDFGIYQSTSNGGDPISAGTAKLYFAASGAATFSSSVTALANANSFGTAGSSGQAMFIQAGSSNQAIKFINAAGGDGTLLIQGTSTSIIYRFDTYSTGNAFAISNAGVITIGALGSGTVTSTSGVLSTTSDMTLKVEDGFIDNALEKISQLKPRYFYWKEESGLPTDIRQLGFYAQEVNQALGEEAANTPKNENDKWGIYDRGIIAMLTKAIQELSAEITILKNK